MAFDACLRRDMPAGDDTSVVAACKVSFARQGQDCGAARRSGRLTRRDPVRQHGERLAEIGVLHDDS